MRNGDHVSISNWAAVASYQILTIELSGDTEKSAKILKPAEVRNEKLRRAN